MEPKIYAFVPTDHRGKPRESDRWLIRSRCMYGKNRKPNLGCVDEHQSHSIRPKPHFRRREVPLTITKQEEVRDMALHVPRPPCTNHSLGTLADEIPNKSRQFLFEFLTSSKNVWFPADLSIDIDVDKGLCFPWLSQDPAYLHSILFAASGIHDYFTHKGLSTLTFYHLGKAISFIHQHMDNVAGQLRDSTVSAIITLVLLSSNFVDYSSAEVHAKGLRQIVRLRGGLSAFRKNPSLLIKLCRVDFAYYLHTGHTPVFFADAIAFSYFPGGLNLDGGPEDNTLFNIPEVIQDLSGQNIACLFRDLQSFSKDLNALKENDQKLPQARFQQQVCRLQYRLLHLQGKLESILDECLRLAMLAYLTTTFQIPFNEVRYPHLAKQLRTCYSAIEVADNRLQHLALWLLTIGAISLYGLQDPWLRERWRIDIPQRLNWDEAKETLHTYPWIDSIHGSLAESAFHVLQYGIDLGPGDSEGLCASGWAICSLEL
ncbi:hypothetical protein BX600DRAFT_436407 [Xylariales sp. PMI_506]|nr:hypothetical protein BX600DRAFT_436407 [Xylariales sp. PMI_506]